VNRAVLDTNVLVSGFLSPHGPPGRIVDWLRDGTVQAVLDDRIFDEYADVLARPAFDLPVEEVSIVLDSIRRHAQWITAASEATASGLPDPDDAPFLECARSARVPVVTGNARHYPKGVAGKVRILTPDEFARSLSEGLQGGAQDVGSAEVQ
jgi:uncharacterized protein